MTKVDMPELGRFAEPALLILVSFSEGPKHGYAIMTDVETGTGRPLGPGTLTPPSRGSRSAGLSKPSRPSSGAGRTG